MRRGDLEANLLVAFGDDREVEAGGEDPVVVEMAHEGGGTGGVADHEWYHRVLAWDGLVAEIHEPFLEARGHCPEVVQKGPAKSRVDYLDRLASRRRLTDGDWVRVDVHRCGFAKVSDQSRAAGDIASVDPERLSECAHQDVGGSAFGELLGAAAGGAKGSDAMGVVYKDDDVLGEPSGRRAARSSPWELRVDCPIGFLNWDVFFYWPTQNYPDGIYGGAIERIADWAYVHE